MLSISLTFLTVPYILGFTSAEKGGFGPFSLKLVNWTDCGDNDTSKLHFNLTVSDHNKTFDLINGNMNFPSGFTNDMMMKMDVAAWRNNSWIDKIYSLNFKTACNSMRELIRNTFSEITQHMKIKDECPIPPGTYVFKDFLMDLKVNIKEIEHGGYKGRYVVYQGGDLIGCFEVFVIAMPK